MKHNMIFIVGVWLLSAICSGCGSKNSDENGMQHGEVSFIVPLAEVSNGECLSVERLFSRLRSVSPATMSRRFSTAFSVQAASVPKQGEADAPPNTEETMSNLRDNFARFLARNTFVFKDEPLHNFLEEFGTMVQDGCTSVHFVDDVEMTEDFQITEFTGDSVRFEKKGHRSYTVKLLDPQSMEIKTKRRAVDFCSPTDQAEVEYTQILRWGGEETFVNQEEMVSIELLNKLSNSMPQVPASIRSASAGSAAGWTTSIPVVDLKAVMTIPASNNLRDCPVTASDGPGSAAEPSPAPAGPAPGSSDPSSTIDPNASDGGPGPSVGN